MRKSLCIFSLLVFFLGLANAQGHVEENSLYTLKIKVKVANVRSGPSLSSSIVTQLREGTILQALEKQGDWYFILLPDQGNLPERRAYIHLSVVNVISRKDEETLSKKEPADLSSPAAAKDRLEEKNQRPVQEQNQTIRDIAEESKPFKRIYLSAGFNAGFQEEFLSSTFSETIYYETATSSLGYQVKKGTPFTAALGFRITRSLGVELGVDVSSRNLESTYSSSIPHPLLFENPRTASGTGSYSLSENSLFLNVVFGKRFGRFGVDLFGGPAYILSKAQIISEMSFSHSYPYDDISLSIKTAEVSMNVFGFNGGLRILFHFSESAALFAGARYIGGKASFDPETGLPAPEITLSGLRAGGGLKVLF